MKTIKSKEINTVKSQAKELINTINEATKKDILNKWFLSQLLTKYSLNHLNSDTLSLEKAKEKMIKKVQKNLAKKVEKIESKYFLFSCICREVKSIEINTSWFNGGSYGWQAQSELIVNFTNYTREFYNGSKTGGCGYDKLSTAISNCLNQSNDLRKLLHKVANKAENKGIHYKNILGYGCGYGVTPYFEAGVGENSIINVLENLGFKIVAKHSANKFDYVKLSKK